MDAHSEKTNEISYDGKEDNTQNPEENALEQQTTSNRDGATHKRSGKLQDEFKNSYTRQPKTSDKHVLEKGQQETHGRTQSQREITDRTTEGTTKKTCGKKSRRLVKKHPIKELTNG